MMDEPFLLDTDEGEAIRFAGSLVIERITAEDTNGAYSLIEQHGAPGFETPYHVHHDEMEVFYVTEGEITVFTEGGTFTATPGRTVVLPPDQPHGFRVTGNGPGRILVICSPAGLEEFFHEAGEPATDRTIPEPSEPDEELMNALADKYNLEFLGPLPDSSE